MKRARPPITIFLLCLFILNITANGTAADKPPAASEKTGAGGDFRLRTLWRNFWQDEKKIWTAPLHLRPKHLPLLAGLAAATALLIANDEHLNGEVQDYRAKHPALDKLQPFFTDMGSIPVDCAVSGVFILSGLIGKNRKAIETGVLSAQVMLHTGLLTEAAKILGGRQRPLVDGTDRWYGPGQFFAHLGQSDTSLHTSFFSGHSARAWGLAAVIAGQYRQFWVGALCYSLATAVSLSRASLGRHWPSDVFVGALAGLAVGRLVLRNQRRHSTIVPSIAPDKVALSWRFVF